ncbi:MAG: hypothetical protein PHQ23_08370 [Candidatus Wallbacteria bacterium]|nr:hypothetical protein [Candidatus Wallbacteria bacterium]
MKVTEKDKSFLVSYLDIKDADLDKLFHTIRSLPVDGEKNRESYVNKLCSNKPGRDAYEIKKILLHRLFEE